MCKESNQDHARETNFCEEQRARFGEQNGAKWKMICSDTVFCSSLNRVCFSAKPQSLSLCFHKFHYQNS